MAVKERENVLEWVQEAEKLGAGEILLTSVDQEGTRKGFDRELIREVHVPVIAAGGAGSCQDVIDILPRMPLVVHRYCITISVRYRN